MNDFQEILSSLPQWVQLIILTAVVGSGILFGRRGAGKTRKTSKSVLKSKPKLPINDSPGRSGSDATRDLTPSEINKLNISYAPSMDYDPDPGEVVWTWVPYVENDGRGKDRPVLIIARINAQSVAGCYLSTKDHRGFIEVGPGPWDSKGRTSYLSMQRILRITHDGMRREGSIMPKKTFEAVANELRSKFRI